MACKDSIPIFLGHRIDCNHSFWLGSIAGPVLGSHSFPGMRMLTNNYKRSEAYAITACMLLCGGGDQLKVDFGEGREKGYDRGREAGRAVREEGLEEGRRGWDIRGVESIARPKSLV